MPECLPDIPRYVRKHGGEWQGADHQNGPWRPIPAPQSGLPWKTDEPAVPESREPASVTAETNPSPADRMALALCRAGGYPGPCHVSEICNCCREQAAAVIRELAEQVVPEGKVYTETVPDAGVFVSTEPPARFRSKILDLATELEGHH